MSDVRTRVLVPLAILATSVLAGCGGGGGGDVSVEQAAARCVEQAKTLGPAVRSSIEASCGRMRTYCADEARRREPLCQQFLARYR